MLKCMIRWNILLENEFKDAFISSSSFCLFYLAKESVKIYCFKECTLGLKDQI